MLRRTAAGAAALGAAALAALSSTPSAALGSTASAALGTAPPVYPVPPIDPPPPSRAGLLIRPAPSSTPAPPSRAHLPTHPAPPSGVDSAVALPPDQAEALATAVSAPPGGETTTAVSPREALARSALPGAETSVDPELTPGEAVGLAAVSPLKLTMCWADRAWWQWGTWPYQQRITNTTYWCAVYGQRITYRSTSVTTGGTLCSTNWRADQLIGGGIGFHGMTVRASAGFSCPTVIPWLTLHPTHYLDVFFGDRGRAVILGGD